MQGGARRSAIWAGLRWDHPDIMKFIGLKDWPDHIRKAKEKDFNAWAPMDGTNISVQLDDEFFMAYHDEYNPRHIWAHMVYAHTMRHMLETAEPGFSVDTGINHRETLRNACTEVTSEDDSDICNLGSINMARVDTAEEFRSIVRLGTAFLLAGTLYSDIPYTKVGEIRTKNRRLGLGLMGMHEWLLKRGYRYEQNAELASWLDIYKESDQYAATYAAQWGLTIPVKTRAIAPTGTIGIIAETTTGIEPIFCVAFRRRYLDGTAWKAQYVLDPTAQRLIAGGAKPDSIEDAYTLAGDIERRVRFQAFVQGYVDHSISSTLNLPAWGSEQNNQGTVEAISNMLIRYLPRLRGITAYPDGCRGGQPLTPVKYETAVSHVGQVFIEGTDLCDLTRGGSCGA